MLQSWPDRADAAEEAVLTRHVRRVWGLPGTALGVVAWPPVRRERAFFRWHYWWQAHLIDCMVDAAVREPSVRRRRRIARVARSHRLRNLTGWTNSYYDDMAWLGLALERAQRLHLIDFRSAVADLESELFESWNPAAGGGIPWNTKGDFFNTPANGPAAIMLARTGKVWRAQAMADWMDETLVDRRTGLVLDGIHPDGRLDTAEYTYCQGVAMGVETELAVRLGSVRHARRVHRLVAATERRFTVDGVITGSGGGDGGLFNGVLARNLALVATLLPGDDAASERTRSSAAHIVRASAQAAWENSLRIEGLPLFGHDWSRQAQLPGTGGTIATFTGGTVRSSAVPERDLSVQLSGWMLLEAVCTLPR